MNFLKKTSFMKLQHMIFRRFNTSELRLKKIQNLQEKYSQITSEYNDSPIKITIGEDKNFPGLAFKTTPYDIIK